MIVFVLHISQWSKGHIASSTEQWPWSCWLFSLCCFSQSLYGILTSRTFLKVEGGKKSVWEDLEGWLEMKFVHKGETISKLTCKSLVFFSFPQVWITLGLRKWCKRVEQTILSMPYFSRRKGTYVVPSDSMENILKVNVGKMAFPNH